MSSNSDFNIIQESLNTVLNALKPLTAEQRRSVLQSVANLFGETDQIPPQPSSPQDSLARQEGLKNPIKLQEFVFNKKTQNDSIAVTVLAYYLKKYGNKELFKTSDLEELHKEANTGRVFGNIAKTVNNATLRNNFLAKVGDGSKKITLLGELVVEALPDEEKVKQIIKENKVKKRKIKKNKPEDKEE